MRANLWTPEDDEILKTFYPTESLQDVISRLSFPRNEQAVYQRVSKLKIKNDSYEFWAEEELKTLKGCYENERKPVILSLLPNRTWGKIRAMAKKLDLKKRTKGMDQIMGNVAPLLEDVPESLYWVGFLLADGHFSNTNRIQLSLGNLDQAHIMKFANFLERDFITIKETLSSVAIMDQQNVTLLKEKYDIKSHKTIYPPDLDFYKAMPKDLWWPLVIGFVDGDGHIGTQTYRKDLKIRYVKAG